MGLLQKTASHEQISIPTPSKPGPLSLVGGTVVQGEQATTNMPPPRPRPPPPRPPPPPQQTTNSFLFLDFHPTRSASPQLIKHSKPECYHSPGPPKLLPCHTAVQTKIQTQCSLDPARQMSFSSLRHEGQLGERMRTSLSTEMKGAGGGGVKRGCSSMIVCCLMCEALGFP